MKKIILFLSLLVTISALGQNKDALREVAEVTFYGIDYSKVKVYGAKETPYHFKVIFEDINNLFTQEVRKYNPEKYFKKVVVGIELEEVITRAKKIDESILNSVVLNHEITRDDLDKMIKSFPVKTQKGTAIIVIAELIDKSTNRGYYHIVFFNPKTKEIVDTWKVSGKGSGVGLRNFWANSVNRALHSSKL